MLTEDLVSLVNNCRALSAHALAFSVAHAAIHHAPTPANNVAIIIMAMMIIIRTGPLTVEADHIDRRR